MGKRDRSDLGWRRKIHAILPALRPACAGLFLLGGAVHLRADNGWEGNILSATWENDAVASEDRHYTQGGRLSFLSRDDAMWSWLKRFSRWLPAPGIEVQTEKWGLAVSQEIYTPEDQQTPDLVVNDRPYAGWLYSTLTLQRRGSGPGRWLARENLRLDLGVIGPEALGEEAQTAFHIKDPKGWHHQLETEFGINVQYQRQYFFTTKLKDQHWGLDFIPHAEVSAGNVDSHLGAGGVVRFGYRSPNEFEVVLGRSTTHWGVYLFGGLEGRCVLRNIFLDGNSFKTSHSVSRIPLVGDAKAGFTVALKRIELTASVVFRTREFEQQNEADTFGSLVLTFKF